MDVKIKISSRRLKSGRCQVRFQAFSMNGQNWYGYALAEPEDTLKAVVERIENRFYQAEDKLALHQDVLYHLNGINTQPDNLMIFKQA